MGNKTCRTCALFANNRPGEWIGPSCSGNREWCSFWQPMQKAASETTIKITINKKEILRDLEEIRKTTEEVVELLEKIKCPPQPVYPFWPYPGDCTITCGGGGTQQ